MAAMGDGAFSRLIEAANEVRNTTNTTLLGSRSGAFYQVTRGSVVKESQAKGIRTAKSYNLKPSKIKVGKATRRVYQASAPGEAPASLTGELRQSVGITAHIQGGKMTAEIGTKLDKGLYLEYGTHDGHIKARPWLKPSFDRSLDAVKAILSRRWVE